MKNIYDGIATTNAKGFAVVKLPAWFQALNRTFRYQLTSLSGLQNVAVAKEISHNRFTIQSEKPRSRVSWQVDRASGMTPYANAHRIQPSWRRRPQPTRASISIRSCTASRSRSPIERTTSKADSRLRCRPRQLVKVTARCGVPGDRRVVGNVARDDRARADERALADAHSAEDGRAGADRGSVRDHRPLQLPVRLGRDFASRAGRARVTCR